MIRGLVESVEADTQEAQWSLLCILAGREIVLDPAERNGALRRAELLLAAGGDPHRRLELYGRAASSVAGDLDDAVRRASLEAGLAGLTEEVEGFPRTRDSLMLLQADLDLAWQVYAMSLLAEDLSD